MTKVKQKLKRKRCAPSSKKANHIFKMNDITSISKIKYASKLQILAGYFFLQFWERMIPSEILSAWKTTLS